MKQTVYNNVHRTIHSLRLLQIIIVVSYVIVNFILSLNFLEKAFRNQKRSELNFLKFSCAAEYRNNNCLRKRVINVRGKTF